MWEVCDATPAVKHVCGITVHAIYLSCCIFTLLLLLLPCCYCCPPQVDGDKLQGRGVTDCLGHVALLTELFRQLAVVKPKLRPTVLGCFIANEENATVRHPDMELHCILPR
jgi:hypothetical protein